MRKIFRGRCERYLLNSGRGVQDIDDQPVGKGDPGGRFIDDGDRVEGIRA